MQYLLTVVVTEQLLSYTSLTFLGLAFKEGLLTKAKLIALDWTLFLVSVIVSTLSLSIPHVPNVFLAAAYNAYYGQSLQMHASCGSHQNR